MNLQAQDGFLADRISAHRAYTPEGYLICLGVPVARTGTQTYKATELDKDGTLGLSGLVDVYRSPDEVFKQASIQSFEGKSVVSPHPPQFLDADNDSLYSKGHGQNFRAGTHPETGAPVLLADLVIKDKSLRQMIEDGHRVEISGGYVYDLERADDEFSPRSRFVQRNIMGNHIAIVPTGRAGSDIRVLDAKPPEEGETMAEEAVKTAEKPGMLSELATFCKTLGLRLVASDEDPGAVERNRRKDEEALTKKLRVDDQKTEDEEMEKEEKGAKKTDPKEEAKDAKSATDARLDRVCDLLEKTLAKDSAKAEDKCTCDAEEGEGHKKGCAMYKEEAKDADLIPIHKLHGDEIPKNPIPGADKALENLRKIRPLIAQSGDRQAIDAYNDAVRQLKQGVDVGNDGSYADFTNLKKPDKVVEDEGRHRVGVDHKKGEDAGESFELAASRFHRMNASEVKKQ